MVTVITGPDQVCEGFYVVERNVLTMVDGETGDAISLDGETTVSAKLNPDSNADQIAKLLTKRIRKALRGDAVEGFDRPLVYPRASIA
jgi:hypothetical protein